MGQTIDWVDKGFVATVYTYVDAVQKIGCRGLARMQSLLPSIHSFCLHHPCTKVIVSPSLMFHLSNSGRRCPVSRYALLSLLISKFKDCNQLSLFIILSLSLLRMQRLTRAAHEQLLTGCKNKTSQDYSRGA